MLLQIDCTRPCAHQVLQCSSCRHQLRPLLAQLAQLKQITFHLQGTNLVAALRGAAALTSRPPSDIAA